MSAPTGCDLRTVDLLARLQLVARRHGHELELVRASPELEALLALVGLDVVLRLQPRGEAEERKDPVGVEEERQLDDPAA
jgi:STAS domain-containing protein